MGYDRGMPRYVVLHHETPAGYPRKTHFDLMLEHNGVLRTWAIEKMPVENESVTAEQLADHRLTYLDYEGPISGNRGRVSRVADGQYEIKAESATEITVELHGEKLCGTLRLTRDEMKTHLWRVSLVPG